MRCIEIFIKLVDKGLPYEINNNMRCIEIHHVSKETQRVKWINNNMRCIEMSYQLVLLLLHY